MLLLGLLALFSCQKQRRALPSFKETYSNEDKNPFGGYLTFQTVRALYDDVNIAYGNALILEPELEAHKDPKSHALYMIISDRLFLPERDADWLIQYVENGNDLFISANIISDNFLKKLRVKTNQSMAYLNEKWGEMRDTRVRISFGEDLPDLPFSYYYYPFNNHFRQGDSALVTHILGTDDHNLPNFSSIFIGKGRLYLHLAPRSLGNYFLLTGNNMNYLHHVLNYLRPDPVAVYWDEYYKNIDFTNRRYQSQKDEDDFSTLQVIMSHPSLKWAFFLATGAFIMFLLSNMKRKQRLIPVQEKPSNSSVDFVETVGRLYFVHKNNKNIAGKLITYFYENIRTRYLLRIDHSESFAARLAGKKGMPPEQITELLINIRQAEESEEISDEQLLKLNRLLEKFYNYK